MGTSVVAGAESAILSIAGTASTLNTDLQDALARLVSARSVVDGIQSVAVDVGKISAALHDISDVLPLLEGIPVVGEVAEVLSPVIKVAREISDGIRDTTTRLVDATIRPIAAALDDIFAGATRVQAITSRIPNDCQALGTGLKVASAFYVLVQPFAQPGGEGAVSEFVVQVQEVERGVSTATPAISDALNAMSAAAGTLHGIVQSLEQVGSGAFDEAVSAAQGLADKLSPIYEAIQTVLGAVAPLRWALDAVAWITDEVLTPVLDFVLKETGLEALFDGIEQALASGLAPIRSVMEQVSASIEQGAISGVKEVLGVSAAVQLEGDWQNLRSLVASFQPDGDGSFRSVVTKALNAVVGDPHAPLPPWPTSPGGTRA